MKSKFLIILLFSFAKISYSQDYLNDIAKKSCDCLNKLSDTLTGERINFEMGICVINAASPFRKQIKNDFKIDFDKLDKEGEELGRIIGIKMATLCPDGLMKLINAKKKNESEEITENIIEGQITAILDNKFVEFSIKDNKGKLSRYYWLTFIESKTDLPANYKKMIDKSVKIVFMPQEFFDARIGEYSKFNIIKKIELLNK